MLLSFCITLPPLSTAAGIASVFMIVYSFNSFNFARQLRVAGEMWETARKD